MISILIPVYNYDITPLVNCLYQVTSESEDYDEIIIGADGCDDTFLISYRSLLDSPGIKLCESKKNIGRAAIRNLMVDMARGSYVLFIDADALIEGSASSYLGNWIDHINNAQVTCGGTAYRDIPPDDPDKYLRWYYGSHKEQKPVKKRNSRPFSSFSSFNFLAEKQVMQKFRFNEELIKYGHEDTLLGYNLKMAGIIIRHIDNPLIHDGLEPNREFILKTQEGVHNLSILYDMVSNRKVFASTVRLTRVYKRLHIFGITYLISKFFKKRKRRIEIILRAKKYPLGLFSLYKLGLFCFYRYGNE